MGGLCCKYDQKIPTTKNKYKDACEIYISIIDITKGISIEKR